MYDLCDLRKLIVDLRHFEEELKASTSLSLNEALCLCQAHKGKQDPGGLADELDLSPSRLSRILDTLEKRCLIERSLATADKRAVVVSLTEEGERLVRQLHCTEIPLPGHLEQAIETMHEPMHTGASS